MGSANAFTPHRTPNSFYADLTYKSSSSRPMPPFKINKSAKIYSFSIFLLWLVGQVVALLKNDKKML